MLKNDEFVSGYAEHLVHKLTLDQRETVFKCIESFFDSNTLEKAKRDVIALIQERAEMDIRILELDKISM